MNFLLELRLPCLWSSLLDEKHYFYGADCFNPTIDSIFYVREKIYNLGYVLGAIYASRFVLFHFVVIKLTEADTMIFLIATKTFLIGFMLVIEGVEMVASTAERYSVSAYSAVSAPISSSSLNNSYSSSSKSTASDGFQYLNGSCNRRTCVFSRFLKAAPIYSALYLSFIDFSTR